MVPQLQVGTPEECGQVLVKVALVTAASRGMGAAIARRLAEDGYRLALMSRGEDLSAIANELNALACAGSVANPEDLGRFVEAAIEEYGRIDVVVNNTGHAAKGDLLDLSDDEWHDGAYFGCVGSICHRRLGGGPPEC